MDVDDVLKVVIPKSKRKKIEATGQEKWVNWVILVLPTNHPNETPGRE